MLNILLLVLCFSSSWIFEQFFILVFCSDLERGFWYEGRNWVFEVLRGQEFVLKIIQASLGKLSQRNVQKNAKKTQIIATTKRLKFTTMRNFNFNSVHSHLQSRTRQKMSQKKFQFINFYPNPHWLRDIELENCLFLKKLFFTMEIRIRPSSFISFISEHNINLDIFISITILWDLLSLLIYELFV